MKTLLRLVLAIVILLVCASLARALPNIVLYRLQDKAWVVDDNYWPKGRIALLVHGFPMFGGTNNRAGLLPLANYFSTSRKVGPTRLPAYDTICAVEYPKNNHLIQTAAALADLVHLECRNLPADVKIDVFAHSMGGLVAGSACDVPEVLLGTKPMSDRVAHLVTMGTPRGGFASAELDIFKQVFGDLPEIDDMGSGGMFIQGVLNFPSKSKPKAPCDYYALVGRRSYRPVEFLSDKSPAIAKGLKGLMDVLHDVHDGLVEADSAGYDTSEFYRSYKKVELDLNHDYLKSHQEAFDAIDGWMVMDNWFGQAAAPSYDDWWPTAVTPPADYDGPFTLPAGRQIAFLSNRDGATAVYTLDTKTYDLWKVQDLKGFHEAYSFSASGKYILLVDDQNYINIAAVDWDQKQTTVYKTSLKVSSVYFATCLWKGSSWPIHEFSNWESETSFHFANEQNQIKLVNFSFSEEERNISADLRALLIDIGMKTTQTVMKTTLSEPATKSFFACAKDGNGFMQIVSVDCNYRPAEWLTQEKCSSIEENAWGDKVAFVSDRSGHTNIYSMQKGAPNSLTNLTNATEDEFEPHWLYSATKIIFTVMVQGHKRIYTMDASGANRALLDVS